MENQEQPDIDYRPGRPKIDPEKKLKQHSFSLGKKHYLKIKAYANKYDIGLSEALRGMIDELRI